MGRDWKCTLKEGCKKYEFESRAAQWEACILRRVPKTSTANLAAKLCRNDSVEDYSEFMTMSVFIRFRVPGWTAFCT